jgi:hypothetical protein
MLLWISFFCKEWFSFKRIEEKKMVGCGCGAVGGWGASMALTL